MSEKTIKITHGFVVKETGADGIDREVRIRRTDCGDTLLEVITKWPNREPAITGIRFTQVGLNLVVSSLLEAQLNMDAWKVPAQEDK